MAAERAEYVALRDLEVPPNSMSGVFAARTGDPVPAGVVENVGYVIGEDVAPSGLALMPKPARNASRAAWAAYAVDQGATQDAVDGMTRGQLTAQFDDDQYQPTEEEMAAHENEKHAEGEA